MYFESWASYLNKIEPIKPKYQENFTNTIH
jgi:hypothetical protein